MSKGWVGIAPRHTSESRSVTVALSSTAEPNATLELLLAALASQRRATMALYRLVRGMAGFRNRPSRKKRYQHLPASRTLRQATGPSLADVGLQSEPGIVPETPIAKPAVSVPLLQVRCFGRFEVFREGTPVKHWRRGKAKTLFKYLVVRRQPVPRDVLLDLLWPEADPHVAINGLRVALHALRQALGPCDVRGRNCVIFDGGNYLLNPEARLWVDAEEFTAHFGAGRRLERQQRLAEAVRRYELAEAIYRDDYLMEDVYEDWTLVQREEFKDQYLMVLTKLADHCIQRGDAEGCIIHCHKILQKDACREDAYRRLMRCYAQLDQRSQALHWYDLCVRTLRQELDVAPSEQTRRLYEQIVTGKGV